MEERHNQLAKEFNNHPIDIYDVYKTVLSPQGEYTGHKDRYTAKCGFLFALKGEATFTFNNTAYRMKAGDVLIGGFNMSLEIQVGDSDFKYYLIHFLPGERLVEEKLLMKEVSMLKAGLEPSMLMALEELLEISTFPGDMEKLEMKTIFFRLIHQVLSAERERQQKHEAPFITQALQYIHNHYIEQLTLEGIAGLYQLKPKYFSYAFRKYNGVSPINYLIQYRMNKAHEMLINSSCSVHEIAKSVGYLDAHYFSRLFKKHKKMSPTEARMCNQVK